PPPSASVGSVDSTPPPAPPQLSTLPLPAALPISLRIARSATLDVLRQRRRRSDEALDEQTEPADPAPSQAQQLQSARNLQLLERVLARLPHEQREILLLREVEGLSYDDLAATLQINPGTVKSRLARARAALLHAYRQANGGTHDD